MGANLLIIDADGHLNDPREEIEQRMREQHRYYRSPTPRGYESWDRSFGGTLGKHHHDAHIQLRDLDAEGIDVQVLFPSMLSLSAWQNTNAATDYARSYNDWLVDFCAADPARLKGVAQVALQDVDSAIEEARRAIEDLGHVAIMIGTNVLDQDLGELQFWPFYEAVQSLGVPLAIHGGINASERMYARFGKSFISVHTVAFPFECMAAVTGLVYAGVPERFPDLKLLVLEGCAGWIPFLMDRMDEEFELRGHRETPLLKKKPSQYLKEGEFYFGFEIEESTLPLVIDQIGAHKLVYASDYPHWDSSWPNTVKTFLDRDDLSEADKRQILGENARRIYGFTTP